MSETTVYRGVHARHHAHIAALEGRAVPGNPSGTVTPEQHNEGGEEANSPYTSWTRNYKIAYDRAVTDGPGGVILCLPFEAPESGDTWSWVRSPDYFNEEEVLLLGERAGATVEMI